MKCLLLWFLMLGTLSASAQPSFRKIREKQVRKWIQVLASDSLEGRKLFTPGLEKAARYLEGEFRNAGLQPLPGANGFAQSFELFRYEPGEVTVEVNGKAISGENCIVLGNGETLSWSQLPEKVVYATSRESLSRDLFRQLGESLDMLVVADTSLARQLSRFRRNSPARFGGSGNIVVLFFQDSVRQIRLEAKGKRETSRLANIAGWLPGKSKKEEMVIFSGHYDHLGVGKPVNGDSIYNGANDDASGVTAVLALANYFSRVRDRERSILFVAFTGEESGGYGSRYFSKDLEPEKVVAMFNIEMIGTESKWGKGSAYITGFDKSDFGSLLQQNLKGSRFSFHPDPYTEQQLFYRSDNATLARLGVPAHTISSSKMDNEPNYHKVSDEVSTLDLKNMTEIIRAIGMSSLPIIEGLETPSRVDTSTLR